MKRSTLIPKIGAALLVLTTTAFVACANKPAASTNSEADVGDGVLRIGSTTEVVKWSPINSVSITDQWAMNQAYMPLLWPTKEGEFIPALALSVEPSENAATAEIKLDPNYVWSDGVPITAEDVIFTFERLRDDRLLSGGAYIGNYESASAEDDHTVIVKLKQPSYSWVLDVRQSLRVLPKHTFEKVPNLQNLSIEKAPEYWVSSGSYTLDKVEPGQRYRFIPNPHYPYRAPGNEALTAVEIVLFSDLNTMQLALQNNDIDLMAPVVPASALGELQQKPNIKIASAVKSNNLTKLSFNTSRAPFKDAEVRRALAGLIDPQVIVKNVLLGEGDLMVGPLTPPHSEYQPPLTLHKNTPEETKKVLASAGLSNLTIDLLCDQGNANQAKSAQLVKDMFAKADVTVNVKCAERVTALAAGQAGEFDVFIHKLNIQYSPGTALYLQFDPSNPTGLNHNFNDDPKATELFNKARTVVTKDEYMKAVQEAATYVHEQAYIVPLFSERLNSAYNDSRFEGYIPASIEMTTMLASNSLAALTPTKKSR